MDGAERRDLVLDDLDHGVAVVVGPRGIPELHVGRVALGAGGEVVLLDARDRPRGDIVPGEGHGTRHGDPASAVDVRNGVRAEIVAQGA